jgi:UDP-N-acetylglucosamine:LPS N-acetylglucosamine transferase
MEALACHIPLIAYRPLPGHGVANAAAFQQAGLAPWARCVEELSDLLLAVADRGGSAPGAASNLLAYPDPAQAILQLATSRPTSGPQSPITMTSGDRELVSAGQGSAPIHGSR